MEKKNSLALSCIQRQTLTGTGEGETDLGMIFSRSRSREGLSGFSGLGSVTMAFSCLSFSSLTQSLFCISSWVAATRRSYRDQRQITVCFIPLHKHTTSPTLHLENDSSPRLPEINKHQSSATAQKCTVFNLRRTLTHSFCHFIDVSVTMPCNLASNLRLSENCR